MEFQALHGLAKKLLGVEAIRKEVLRVLSDDPTFQGIQHDIAAEHSGHSSTPGLRRRLPAARVVARSVSDGLDDPLADTWTEPSTAPGSPAAESDPKTLNDTLELASMQSDWDGSDFELLPGPNPPSESDPALGEQPAGAGKENIGQRLLNWLQECSKSIATVVGGVCQGAVSLMKGVLRDCTKLMQDVASWCVQSIDTLRKQVSSMPRWAKITAGVVAVAALMGAMVMLLMPPAPPFLL